ncbi:NAD-dependent epimerase/dehydratase family protein [Microbacterium saperdae]
MKIAVVGGSGLVGSMIVPALTGEHEVLIIDPVAPRFPTDARWRAVDLRDPGALDDALRGCAAVVYGAMGRKDGWEASFAWAESQFDMNVKLLWAVADASRRVGVSRIVHLSTMSVFDDYLVSGSDETSAPDAKDVYGLTKRLGELVCIAAAQGGDMTAVSLRLVGPTPDEEWERFDDPILAPVITAGSDVAAAVAAALRLEMAAGTWEAFTISGDAQQRVLAQANTFERLGWRPARVRSVEGEEGLA